MSENERVPAKPPDAGGRDGFWGRGQRGRGFAQGAHLDHGREDYGATGRGQNARPADADGGPAEDPTPGPALATTPGAGSPARD